MELHTHTHTHIKHLNTTTISSILINQLAYRYTRMLQQFKRTLYAKYILVKLIDLEEWHKHVEIYIIK